MSDDRLTLVRARIDRLLAERDQVRGRARRATNPAARQTYSCRMLEIVGQANEAIEALNGLVVTGTDRVTPLDMGAELAALSPLAEG